MDVSGLIFVLWLTLCDISVIYGQRACRRLRKPWNGGFVGQCNRNVGAECVMQCREPYILVGSRVRTCRADGLWSGRTTACELDGCPNCGGGGGGGNCRNLYEPANGHTSGQCTPGMYGQSCRFQCLDGYELEGQSILNCLNSGRWSSGVPDCRRRSGAICEDLVVANAFVNCRQQGGQAVCRVTCNEGYMIVGSSVVTCSSSGVWNEQVPTCRSSGVEVGGGCSTLVAPEGGRLVGNCRAASTGDTCQLVCLGGYRPTDTRILVCQTNGRWSDSLPRCLGETGGLFCPNLLPPASGGLSGVCSPGQAGQRCTFYCNAGFELVGQSTLVCGTSGQWSGNVPYCTGGTCPALNTPVNGARSGSCTQATVGQSCSFSCQAGYILTGEATAFCQAGGRWSSNAPTCNRVTCPNLGVPANGFTNGFCSQAAVGQTCNFSCQSGYTLNGQSTLYCQDGGRWSSAAPTCTRSQATTCANLVSPNSGFMIGSCAPGRVGETCVFGCDEGYFLRGQRTLNCQSTGQWSSFTPYCERSGGTNEEGTCPILVPPPNGEFLECDNRSGGQCIAVCQRGYIRSGSRVRTCLTQGSWSGYAPTCTRTGYTYRVVPLWSLIFG